MALAEWRKSRWWYSGGVPVHLEGMVVGLFMWTEVVVDMIDDGAGEMKIM